MATFNDSLFAAFARKKKSDEGMGWQPVEGKAGRRKRRNPNNPKKWIYDDAPRSGDDFTEDEGGVLAPKPPMKGPPDLMAHLDLSKPHDRLAAADMMEERGQISSPEERARQIAFMGHPFLRADMSPDQMRDVTDKYVNGHVVISDGAGVAPKIGNPMGLVPRGEPRVLNAILDALPPSPPTGYGQRRSFADVFALAQSADPSLNIKSFHEAMLKLVDDRQVVLSSHLMDSTGRPIESQIGFYMPFGRSRQECSGMQEPVHGFLQIAAGEDVHPDRRTRYRPDGSQMNVGVARAIARSLARAGDGTLGDIDYYGPLRKLPGLRATDELQYAARAVGVDPDGMDSNGIMDAVRERLLDARREPSAPMVTYEHDLRSTDDRLPAQTRSAFVDKRRGEMAKLPAEARPLFQALVAAAEGANVARKAPTIDEARSQRIRSWDRLVQAVGGAVTPGDDGPTRMHPVALRNFSAAAAAYDRSAVGDDNADPIAAPYWRKDAADSLFDPAGDEHRFNRAALHTLRVWFDRQWRGVGEAKKGWFS